MRQILKTHLTKRRNLYSGAVVMLGSSVLAGCASTNAALDARPPASQIEANDAFQRPLEPQQTLQPETEPRRTERLDGSGRFVGAPSGRFSGTNARGEALAELNLVDASIEEAASTILGNLLNVPFVVEARVEGAITLQTNGPVASEALLSILEDVLRQQGLALVETDGSYRITQVSGANRISAPLAVSSARQLAQPGYKVIVQPLEYVTAEEMALILQPISSDNSVLRVDAARNLLVLAGSQRDLTTMLETIEIFDVDWLKGMSFAIVPISSTSATQVVSDIEEVLGQDGTPFANLVRLVPNDRLKSVVVISPQPEYIDQAEAWIKRFDRQASATDRELFVYNVQYSTAEELASVVQSVLTGRSNPTSRVSTVAPGLDPATVTRDGVIDPPAPVIQSFGSQGRPGSGLSSLSNVQIYPYETKNALVIVATQDEYARVLKMLESLDVVSNQVLLEATIVEVSLRDELSRGIQWFFNSGNYDVTFSDATNGAVGSVFPGFSFVFDDGDAQAALNALASLTDVKVLSSPSIMVLDNHTATLQVGDQVPVTTQSASSIDAINTAIVNSVSFRDTGVILTITPRVNENGLVRLDIEQEVSDVVETVSSGIDSPTIQQRRISTTVAVHDGDSLALGGLIEDSTTVTDTAVPYISAVPLVGELFKSTNEIEDRTELMILIKPRVIRNRGEAQAATEEYRSRLRGLDRFNDALELEPLDDAGE